jgi:hypothetical protein
VDRKKLFAALGGAFGEALLGLGTLVLLYILLLGIGALLLGATGHGLRYLKVVSWFLGGAFGIAIIGFFIERIIRSYREKKPGPSP